MSRLGSGTRRFDPSVHRRRSIRWKDYDYGQAGAYFVTIYAQDRACLFGEIVAGEMVLSASGRLVARYWRDLAVHFAGVVLDAFLMMPNHLHGVVMLRASGDRRPTRVANVGAKHSRTDAVSPTDIDARMLRPYHEHVIRSEDDLCRIRAYVESNPAQWELDQLHPDNPSKW